MADASDEHVSNTTTSPPSSTPPPPPPTTTSTPPPSAKTHSCAKCGKIYSQAKSLKNHVAMYHVGQAVKKFQCTICQRAFMRKDAMVVHMKTHKSKKVNESVSDGEAKDSSEPAKRKAPQPTESAGSKTTGARARVFKYFCYVCKTEFAKLGQLLKHNQEHHGDKIFRCPHDNCCFTSTSNLTLGNHYSIVHSNERAHTCQYCYKGFKTHGTLFAHLKVHTGEKPVTCGKCGKTFPHSRSHNLKRHLDTVHKEKDQFLCQQCGEEFEEYGEKLEHLSNKHPLPPGEERPHSSKSYNCAACEIAFITYQDLYIHNKKSHQEKNTFKCPKCPHIAKNNANLQRHLEKHLETKGHVCPQCPKTFKRASDVIKHLTSHTDERLFTCTFCKKQFKTNAALFVHIRTHTQEKPFKCNHCNEYFSSSRAKIRHATRAHAPQSPLPSPTFPCDECSKVYKTKNGLREHQKMYHLLKGAKMFKCSGCDKAFLTNAKCIVHLATHTGEKPFNCTQCEKSFGTSDCLKSHINLTHTLRFSCDKCDMKFTKKVELSKHKLEEHRRKN